MTAGAPSSGSRVRLCSLHHATPADGAPRCCKYCVFLPRPSVVNQRFQLPRHARRRRSPCCSCIRAPMVKRARPTWLMAQVGRVEPLRSDGGGDALRRVPSVPGPCTTSSCVERSISELARSAERHFDRQLLSVVLPSHSRSAHPASGIERPLRTCAHRADRRAPARGEPVFAGVPCGYGVEMGECGHVIVRTSRCVSSCTEVQKREIAPPMIA